jgi:lysozyme family protein
MQSNWDKSFALMLQSEGGYQDDPHDSGNWLPDGRKGCTNLGVTQTAWEGWLGRVSNEKEMRALTPEIVKPFYKRKYWDACRCDDLPQGVDYLVFDFAVNAGVGRSAKTLQTAAGATPDGALGPITMRAVHAADHVKLIQNFSAEKEAFYRGLDDFKTYGTGWLNRVADVKLKAFSMLS